MSTLGLVLGQTELVGVPARGGDILGGVVDVGVVEPQIQVGILVCGILLGVIQSGSGVGGSQQILYLLLHLGISNHLEGILETLLSDLLHLLLVLGEVHMGDIHSLVGGGGGELVVEAEAVDGARPLGGTVHVEDDILPVGVDVVKGGLKDALARSPRDRACAVEQLELGRGAVLGLHAQDDVAVIVSLELGNLLGGAVVPRVEEDEGILGGGGGIDLRHLQAVHLHPLGLHGVGTAELLGHALMIHCEAVNLQIGIGRLLGLGRIGHNDVIGGNGSILGGGFGGVGGRLGGLLSGSVGGLVGGGIGHGGVFDRAIVAATRGTGGQHGENRDQCQYPSKMLFHGVLLFSSA